MTRIVLIEDDPTQRTLTALVLRSRGWRVLDAESGEQGLRAIRRERPDVVVCDVLMPGMNGYQVLAEVRGDPAIAATPVILLTGLTERGHTRLGMSRGADDYLHKPYQAEELIDAVEGVRRRSRAQRVAVVEEVQAAWESELAEQRESLAATYEQRLLTALNSRWTAETESRAEIRLPKATVLWVDMFRSLHESDAPDDALAPQLRKAYEAARDSLYLFGALEVVHQGEWLLAVFRDDSGDTASAPSRAVRAALALHARAAATLPPDSAAPLSVALHAGPLTLMRVLDPIHGNSGLVPVPGSTLNLVCELGQRARHSGWRIATTAAVTGEVAGLQTVKAVDTLFTREGHALDVHALITGSDRAADEPAVD